MRESKRLIDKRKQNVNLAFKSRQKGERDEGSEKKMSILSKVRKKVIFMRKTLRHICFHMKKKSEIVGLFI